MRFSRWASNLVLGTVLAVLSIPVGVGAQGFFGSDLRWPMRLLVIPEVQRELRLSGEQTADIEAYDRELRDRGKRGWEELQKLTPAEIEKRFVALNAEQERRIETILEPRQLRRLEQLELQKQRLRSLTQRAVADELKLTPEQRRQVESTIEGERDAFRAAFQGFKTAGTMNATGREEARRRHMEVRAATDARLNSILTEGQRKQFQSMLGTPFKFPEWTHRRPRRDDG